MSGRSSCWNDLTVGMFTSLAVNLVNFWHGESLLNELWNSGTVEQWNSRIVEQQNCGIVELWNSETVERGGSINCELELNQLSVTR